MIDTMYSRCTVSVSESIVVENGSVLGLWGGLFGDEEGRSLKGHWVSGQEQFCGRDQS